jgi:hypothetical protein
MDKVQKYNLLNIRNLDTCSLRSYFVSYLIGIHRQNLISTSSKLFGLYRTEEPGQLSRYSD